MDKKRSLESVEEGSACFFCRCGVQKVSLSAEEELIFFLFFFANLKPMIASIFLVKFHGGFALLT